MSTPPNHEVGSPNGFVPGPPGVIHRVDGSPGRIVVQGIGGDPGWRTQPPENLGRSKRFVWLGWKRTVEEALEATRTPGPGVILFDGMDDVGSVARGIRRIKAALPGALTLVWSPVTESGPVLQVLRAGANGYLVKDDRDRTLKQAIEQLADGEPVFSAIVAGHLATWLRAMSESPELQAVHLSPRQVEVARLLCEGRSNKEIADQVAISIDTVKLHVAAVKKKLGVRSRTQITALLGTFCRNGSIPLGR